MYKVSDKALFFKQFFAKMATAATFQGTDGVRQLAKLHWSQAGNSGAYTFS
jgi:hypothetical protein